MSVLRMIPLLASIAILASCIPSKPSAIGFDLPSDFHGSLVLKESKSSVIQWTKKGGVWTIKTDNPVVLIKDLSDLDGEFLKYQANIRGQTSLPLRERVAVAPEEVGFFGGLATAKREIHFFVGSRKEADQYFDALAGK